MLRRYLADFPIHVEESEGRRASNKGKRERRGGIKRNSDLSLSLSLAKSPWRNKKGSRVLSLGHEEPLHLLQYNRPLFTMCKCTALYRQAILRHRDNSLRDVNPRCSREACATEVKQKRCARKRTMSSYFVCNIRLQL